MFSFCAHNFSILNNSQTIIIMDNQSKVMDDDMQTCQSDVSTCIRRTPQHEMIMDPSIKIMNGRPLLFFAKSSQSEGATASTNAVFSAPLLAPPPSSMALPLMMSLPLIAVAIAIGLSLRRRRSRKGPKHIFALSTNLPPCHVPAHPIFGHMPDVFGAPDSSRFNAVFRDHADADGLSTLRFLNVPCVAVLKAEHARMVFRNSMERNGSKIITRHFKKCLGQDSLVMMDGNEADREKWRNHRNLVKVAFTTHAVENMANKVWQVANGFSSSIRRECAKNGQGQVTLEAADIFKWVTLDIFGRVAFDYNFGCTETLSQSLIAQSLNSMVEDSNGRCQGWNLFNPALQFYWMPTKRNTEWQRHHDNVYGTLRQICKKRMAEINESRRRKSNPQDPGSSVHNHESNDLLTALLKSKTDSSPENEDEVIDQLIKMLLTLFFAGYDTSSLSLSMAMWSMAQNPDIQEECAREAHESSTQRQIGGGTLHEDASQWESRLAYCRAVILETLRLFPPVYTNSRNLTKDLKLDGCTIPQGTRVYVPVTQVHTDERNFARPTEFLPERWVRRDTSSGKWVARDYKSEPQSIPNDSTYLPPANPQNLFTFSDGARNCVGHRLALQESTIVFACLVRDFKVNVREGYVMERRKKFAMAPPVELPLILSEREW